MFVVAFLRRRATDVSVFIKLFKLAESSHQDIKTGV
jgi:hypothetical protein